MEMKNIKKVLLLLALSIPTFCFAEKLKVTADANIRTLPSKDGEIIQVAKEGTVVDGEKSTENEEWFQVTIDGEVGFIHNSLVDVKKDFSLVSIFKDFWVWILIDKLILIGVLCYLIFTGKIGKAFLWAGSCLLSTFLIAMIFLLNADSAKGLSFGQVWGCTNLLCLGISPLFLIILIIIVLLCWPSKEKKVYKVVEYWVEED